MRAVSSETFPKHLRIKKTLDFKRLLARGSRSNLDFVRVISLDNNLDYPRLGIVVSKKNLPKAVMRSKFKRAVREMFRRNKKYLQNKDYLVISIKEYNSSYRAEDLENYLRGK